MTDNISSFLPMKKYLIALIPVVVVLTACAPSSTGGMQNGSSDHSDHSEGSSIGTSVGRLNGSPRHQEWVEVKNGNKTIYTWVVYPERTEKTPVVILIHENRGLNDWARSMADQVAEAGYIGVAPDLLSGFSATETRTSDFADEDAARNALSQLNPEAVQSDLAAVAEWAKTIPAGNGKLVSAGFCWGGGQSFQFATTSDDLTAALVFYGSGPTDQSAYEKISIPVYGFYGGADERINATIPQSEQMMTAAGNTYEYEIYDGAGHAYMRSGEDPNGEPANVAARDASWERMKEILSEL
jgi:carboxymethylenebutenolidase